MGGGPDYQFTDLSGVSGMDDPADSRGFALIEEQDPTRCRITTSLFGSWGGNRSAEPSAEWSARDGFGTTVALELDDDLTVFRQHQTEGGFKTQNSATMIVGLGEHDGARSLRVGWLSGKEPTLSGVRSGSLVTVYEDPSTSPTGETFVIESYAKPRSLMTRLPQREVWRQRLLPQPASPNRLAVLHEETPTKEALRLYTTMATWCITCADEMPEFRHLREVFSSAELGMYGLPVDLEDTEEMLGGWAEEPAQRLKAQKELTPNPSFEPRGGSGPGRGTRDPALSGAGAA